MQTKYLVVEKWEKSYPDPIVLHKDDKVTVDTSITDPEWPDWVWCIAPDNKEGWVPVQILEKPVHVSSSRYETVVFEDYSANELTVEKGEILIGDKVLNGWLWCWKKNNDTKGWVPLKNMQLMKI